MAARYYEGETNTMCFQLYAATSRPLPRSEWNMNDPRVHVRELVDSEACLRATFSKPEVQYIGSTTCCGCAFPSVMHQNGGWPYWLDPIEDAEEIAESKRECEELCRLLSQLDEDEVEMYGVWAGHEGTEPLIREEIALTDISGEYFRFKEGGFYRVKFRIQQNRHIAKSRPLSSPSPLNY